MRAMISEVPPMEGVVAYELLELSFSLKLILRSMKSVLWLFLIKTVFNCLV